MSAPQDGLRAGCHKASVGIYFGENVMIASFKMPVSSEGSASPVEPELSSRHTIWEMGLRALRPVSTLLPRLEIEELLQALQASITCMQCVSCTAAAPVCSTQQYNMGFHFAGWTFNIGLHGISVMKSARRRLSLGSIRISPR